MYTTTFVVIEYSGVRGDMHRCILLSAFVAIWHHEDGCNHNGNEKQSDRPTHC